MIENIVNWQIIPYVGIDKLHLSAPRSDVRAFLGQEYITHRNWKAQRDDIDTYDGAALKLHYDKNDLLVFIEVNAPYDPVFEEVHLIGMKLQSAIDSMRSLGYREHFDDAVSCRFDDVGISLYTPTPRGYVESVSVYRKGLFENWADIYDAN